MMWLFDPERLIEDNNDGLTPAPAGQVTIVLNPGERCLSCASITLHGNLLLYADDQACLAKRDPKSSTKDLTRGKQLRDDDEE